LTDDGGAVIDHALPGAVKRLDILLLEGLLWDKLDMRLTRGCADRLSVIAVVLLTAHKGLNILRTDDLDPLAKRLELPRPAEGSRTGFNNDGAGLNLSENFEKQIAHHPAFQHHTTTAIHTVKLEHVLSDIKAEDFDSHRRFPSYNYCRLKACKQAAEPSIPLGGGESLAG
jgi:hypothetical protein